MFESSVEICVFKNDSVEIKKECSLVIYIKLIIELSTCGERVLKSTSSVVRLAGLKASGNKLS